MLLIMVLDNINMMMRDEISRLAYYDGKIMPTTTTTTTTTASTRQILYTKKVDNNIQFFFITLE